MKKVISKKIIFRKWHRKTADQGSALLFAIITLAVLALIAGHVLQTVTPRYHLSYQAAGWQEARLAAEAGTDMAIASVLKNLPDPVASTTDWSGWTKTVAGVNSAIVAGDSPLRRDKAVTVSAGNALTATPPVFLDNVDVTPAGQVLQAMVDVQVTALYPDPYNPDPTGTNHMWFKIRTIGTSAIPGPSRAPMDSADASLRRMSLRSIRPQLTIGATTTVPLPNSSRIVEVLIKPTIPFAQAIVTKNSLTLGNSANWEVNSYDSRDPNKSGLAGIYPGDASPKVQSNGDIGTNGPLISANGAVVKGDASTKGGDNHSTSTVFENVTSNGGVTGTISDTFDQTLTAYDRPTVATFEVNPDYNNGGAFTAGGTVANPLYYRISSLAGIGSFAVSPPPAGTTAYITIFIDYDLNLGNGNGSFITIPPGVIAKLYVRGNIDFGNGAVNTNASSSNLPGNLQIYGEAPAAGTARTLNSNGNPVIAASFYGPDYDVTLRGTAEWSGAIASSTYAINGGGNGGMHYDEALNVLGAIQGFKIVSYLEDSRK